jgi:uncharacterized BrkB/YihY/UPF0761 family membrane protein
MAPSLRTSTRAGYWNFILFRKMQIGLVYGTLTAVIGLMAWMELCALIVFLGAAWNAESAFNPEPPVTSPENWPPRRLES